MSSTSPQVKSFIRLANEYNLRKSDKNLMQLQRQLQILSVVSDLSIFEPTHMETLEFFTRLQQFLLETDSRSPLSWKVINLLIHMSHSPTIRIAMRDEMQFLPVLSPFMLMTKLSKDKTCKILQLLQDLSYGVEIQRLEAWLIKIIPHLINIILESEHVDDVIELAVVTLANLCRGNPPAIILLRECSERKMLLRTLTNLKSPSIRVQLLVSEIMIYVNVDHSKLGTEQIMHTLDLIFMVATDGFADQDETLLQLSKDVFDEIVGRIDLQETIKGYSRFGTTTQNILTYVTMESKAECVGILFSLMAVIVKVEHADVTPFLDLLFTKALPWLPDRRCGSGAQRLLHSLLSVPSDTVLASHVTEFILLIKEGLALKQDFIPTEKTAQWVCSMLALAESLYERDTSFQFTLAKTLAPPTLSSLLHSFLELIKGENFKSVTHSPVNSSSNPSSISNLNHSESSPSKCSSMQKFSETVVRILSLTSQLGYHDPEFKVECSQMLTNPKAIQHVVFCQRATDVNLVTRATNLLCSESIPKENLNALIRAQTEANKQSQITQSVENFSQSESSFFASQGFIPASFASTSSSAEETVDVLLNKLSSTVEKAELRDLPLTEVMELYEYKLTTMMHSKRHLEEALAASESQTRQIRMTALKTDAESCCLRTLIRIWEERVQQSQREKKELEKHVLEIKDSARKLRTELVQEKTALERNLGKCNGELLASKCDIEEKEEEIRRLHRIISEANTENKAFQKQITQEREETQKSKEIVRTLEQREKKSRKEIEESEKENGRLEKVQSSLKKEKAELEMLIRSHEQTLAEKESQIEEMIKENSTLKRIQDMIHNISSGKVAKMSHSPGK